MKAYGSTVGEVQHPVQISHLAGRLLVYITINKAYKFATPPYVLSQRSSRGLHCVHVYIAYSGMGLQTHSPPVLKFSCTLRLLPFWRPKDLTFMRRLAQC
jgi:hypothetical protein